MSKARLVLTALTVEGATPSQVAQRYGVHRSWVYRLKARYDLEGEAAFEPRSRRPTTSPTATPPETIDLVLAVRDHLAQAGLDAGADTIGWHLDHVHHTRLSRATINRILRRAGRVIPEPAKRPKSSYLRFQAAMPNECWQSDFTHYRLATGTDVEIITWLDDHSRYALHLSAHPRITAHIVHKSFLETGSRYGFPASTLTDNGMVYTVRFATGKGGRTPLETELRARGIVQKNSRPNHPTTCGKVERFQQTLKKWLRAQPRQPSTIAELQALLDAFLIEYNTRRPHRSLAHHATPAVAYTSRPKAVPGSDRTRDSHDRVRDDKVSKAGNATLRHNGRLYHIGLGRTYAGTFIRMVIHDLDITIINATTGEILRELILDPNRPYQPSGGPRKTSNGPA
ncbi:MAG: DDE-type integrase/transposase/recombinase [Micropruina sp.]|nr:MAG: DDE-type integrase/transposase/recombinase [Micropruina sp.]